MAKSPDNDLTFVVGVSMFPTLKPGDEVIFFEKCGYKSGDIVSYQVKGENILHRICKIKGEKIYTRGDNNLTIDAYTITKEHIIGKLTKVRRNNKIYKIRNGFPGYLTGKRCLLIKKIKLSIFAIIKPVANLNPITMVLQKIGKTVFINHISIIKQSNNYFMIYCRGMYFGYYDYNKKEWALRNRFKLFFSQDQLQNIIDQIGISQLPAL